MVDVNASDDDYEISGFISLPEVHRSSRNTMITLVNGRVVRNQDLNRVINDAYHSYKPDNYYLKIPKKGLLAFDSLYSN